VAGQAVAAALLLGAGGHGWKRSRRRIGRRSPLASRGCPRAAAADRRSTLEVLQGRCTIPRQGERVARLVQHKRPPGSTCNALLPESATSSKRLSRSARNVRFQLAAHFTLPSMQAFCRFAGGDHRFEGSRTAAALGHRLRFVALICVWRDWFCRSRRAQGIRGFRI
jgi:hypothetical protein